MKHTKSILITLHLLSVIFLANTTKIKSIKVFRNAKNLIEDVPKLHNVENDTDSEIKVLEILVSFQNVTEFLRKVEITQYGFFANVKKDISAIFDEYEFDDFLRTPWKEWKNVIKVITNNYQMFEKYVQKKIFVDETKIDDFISIEAFQNNLQDLKNIFVYKKQTKSFLQKLGQTLSKKVGKSA